MNPSNLKPNRVLVIAYYFPPLGLSGVQRTFKFVKYLPQFGWQPTVLTVTPTGYYAQDYSLLDELHGLNIEIKRVGSLDANRFFRKKGVVKPPSETFRKIFTFVSDTFFIPDNKIGWKRKATKAAEELFRNNSFEVIFSTAPPFTDFLIGEAIAKKMHKPLVLDYRDVWHEYPFKYYPTPLHKLLHYKLEKRILQASSKVITTNRRTKELILRRYKFLPYNDVAIIPHGYDPEDFEDHTSVNIQKPKKMWFTHAGIFYGDRTPVNFLKALKKVFTENAHLKNQIEVNLIGVLQDSYVKIIKSLELQNQVNVLGYLDHNKCVEYLKASDVLWFTLSNDKQSPGKIYEYIGARKPILACVTDGFVKQTVQETGAAFVVDPKNSNQIAEKILQLYSLFSKNKLPKPAEEIVQRYNRIELTRELSKIFGFLVEH